jgi:DNA helicase-2/ATP-dependent DNA helicase PcrA
MNLLRDAGSYTDWEAGRDWLNSADWDAIAIR